MARRKAKRIFNYNCSLTEESFKTTREAPNPDELISVKAFYDLHPDEDDRPEHIKKKLEAEAEVAAALLEPEDESSEE